MLVSPAPGVHSRKVGGGNISTTLESAGKARPRRTQPTGYVQNTKLPLAYYPITSV
jgi:hypothetical protein